MAERPQNGLPTSTGCEDFACLVMFQTHCYDSWLGGAARDGRFFQMSQLGGTLPAPLFLFLAGVSFALVTDKLRQKGRVSERDRAHDDSARRRNLSVGVAFRVQELLLWRWPRAVDGPAARGHPQRDRSFADHDGVACRIAAAGAQSPIRADCGKGRSSRQSLAPQRLPRSRRRCGPPGGRTGSHGGSNLISMECTRSALRSPGCFRFSLGPHLRLRGWRLVSSCYRIGRGGRRPLACCSGWRRRNRVDCVGTMAGCAARATLRRVRFLAHQPKFFSGARRAFCLWSCWRIRVVPVGSRGMGFQPADRNGQVFATGLLGAYRICVWRSFDLAQARPRESAAATFGLAVIFVAMTLLAVARNRFPGRKAEILAFFRRRARA